MSPKVPECIMAEYKHIVHLLLSPASLLLGGQGLLQSFLLVGVNILLIEHDRVSPQFEPVDGQQTLQSLQTHRIQNTTLLTH